MERDVIFSRQVLKEAHKIGYPTLVVDGTNTIDENLSYFETVFGLM